MIFHTLPILFISVVSAVSKGLKHNPKDTIQSNKQISIDVPQYTLPQDGAAFKFLILAAQQVLGPPTPAEKPKSEPVPQPRYALRARKTRNNQNTEDVAANKNKKMHTNIEERKEEDRQDDGEASEEESDIDDSLGTLSIFLC